MSDSQPDRPAAGGRVTVVYPLRTHRGRLQPFPTLYWLSEPALDHTLADFERQGGVRDVETLLHEDPTLLHALQADHRRYIDQRWALLTPADRARVVASPALLEVFLGRGIAGIADFGRVKCLHAHVAHHLVDHNTVGSLLEERWHLPLRALRG